MLHLCGPPRPEKITHTLPPHPSTFRSGMGVPSVLGWVLAVGAPMGAAPTTEPSPGTHVGGTGVAHPTHPFPSTRRPRQLVIHSNFPFKAGAQWGGSQGGGEGGGGGRSFGLAGSSRSRSRLPTLSQKPKPGAGARQRLRRLPAPLLAQKRLGPRAPASRPWQETTKCRRPSWPSRLSATRTWRTS